MNSKIILACIRCNKMDVKFQCERCNETYCSKDCQVSHWPIHRRMCFPMPNLIPLDNPTILLNEHPISSHQYSVTPRERYIKLDSYHKGQYEKKSYTGKKNNNEIFSDTRRFIEQLPSQKHSDSFSGGSESSITEQFRPYSVSFCSFDDFPSINANPIPKKWFEEFFFGEVTDVVVQYFDENPTTSCWVIQQKDVEQRNAIMKNLNLYRSFDSIDSDRIRINNVYNVQFGGACHRGVVLFRINSLDVWVRLIDNGRSFRTRISTIRAISPMPTDTKGLAFEINFEAPRACSVDEVLRVENISYNSDEVIDVRVVEEDKIFTDDDIKSVPLPVDEPMELFCLDCSNINKGYISACESDHQKIESINKISDKISKYCKETDDGKDYRPKLNELCLAYAAAEKTWYRSKCVENVMPNTFRLEMIDYGALADVSCENIRKMVKEFMQPSVIMHQCTIYGIAARPEKPISEKIAKFFNRTPIFCIKRARLVGGQYIINVPDLLKFINDSVNPN